MVKHDSCWFGNPLPGPQDSQTKQDFVILATMVRWYTGNRIESQVKVLKSIYPKHSFIENKGYQQWVLHGFACWLNMHR